MKAAINKVTDRQNLTGEEARNVMEIMLTGQATQAQIAALLTALRMKGETLEEIVGFASVLSDKAEHIHPNVENYIDFVGTGGDRTFTFNISTTAAFIVAAAGLPVAKHGNRSISSKSGAGDVLEELGVNIMAQPKKVEECIEQVGIGFMFAQTFNKSMKYVGQARNEMGARTVFNILGPLANPSGAKNMLVGVYSPDLTEVVAKAMKELGVTNAMVVSGEDNMDEITLTGKTTISEIKDGAVRTYKITPEQFGMKRVSLKELQGGDSQENARITNNILSGMERGAKRDVVLLNAGAALYVGGVADSIGAGIILAAKAIDTQMALQTLEKLVIMSNQ